MNHNDVLNEIASYLSSCEQLMSNGIFSDEVKSSIYNSIFSLYNILSKQDLCFNTEVQKILNQIPDLKNYSDIKPSLFELICMCKFNEQMFLDSDFNISLANMITMYINHIYFSSKESSQNQLGCVRNFTYKAHQINQFLSTYDFLVYFYYYLFIIFEKVGLIDDEFEPWDECLVSYTIYLPIEGVINLVYFNYIVNPQKGDFSELILRDDHKFDIRKISQYDCGFKKESYKFKTNEKQFVFWLDEGIKEIKDVNKDLLKKAYKKSC